MRKKLFTKFFNRIKANDNSSLIINNHEKDAIKIQIELNESPKIVTTKEETIIDTIEKQQKDQKSLIIQIEEKLNFNENFIDLGKFLKNDQIIAIQSVNDGKFFINWKFQNEIFGLKIFDDINKEDLEELCKFIVEFLAKCLEQNHSGITSSSTEKESLPLTSLVNADDLNLLFYAAQNGYTRVVKILLQVAFNVNASHERLLVIDFAYKNHHFETVFELLKLNSMFPYNLNVEECPENIKEFAEMSKKFHENIQAGNIEEISQTLTQHPNLRYFYSPGNLSACAMAIGYKQFDIYELFINKQFFLSIWEEIEELTVNYSKEELKQLREIHFRNKKSIQESHIIALMSKASVGFDVFDVQDKLDHVQRAFRVLNNFMAIQILLKIAALLSDLQIIFDFNRKSVEYLDPTQDRGTLGLFYGNGRIYVGAKQLLDPKTEHEVFATIAHELCHFVLYNIFGKDAKPYDENDEKTAEEFEEISQECNDKKSIDNIISLVYDCYPSEMFHAELIVRIPHFFAHYHNKPDVIEKLKEDFKSLFDFYELNLMPKLENALVKLKKKAEEERRAKDKKISILIRALIIVFISLTCIALLIFYILYSPNLEWSDLKPEEKVKIFNAPVKFKGIDLKFQDVFNTNESGKVYQVLNPYQIKILLKHEVLDLSDPQNKALEADHYLERIEGIFRNDYYCCRWVVDYPIGRNLKTFEIKIGTKIQSDRAEIHPKYKNNSIELIKITNWCGSVYCNDKSNIKTLPVNVSQVFPNIIAYFAIQYDIQHIKYEYFKNLTKLQFLNFWDDSIDTIDENSFDDLIELKYLGLGKNRLQFLSARMLKNNLKLERLHFYKNQISTVTSEHFRHLTNLVDFSLCGNKLTKIDEDLFDTLVNLKILSVCENRLTSLPSKIFYNLGNLEEIIMNQNQLTTLDENIFSKNPKLQKIILIENKITKLSSKVFDNKSKLSCVALELNSCVYNNFGSCDNSIRFLTNDEKKELKRNIDEHC
ncbi:hypothetical protein PVAND_016339 [Polypedilum vanderplanki]|uniref:Uncharacterized protein n=1 Tax=Polypedilum vanderplanki TaxID=319348 RepID=A0A9J6BFM2_POLVA|nr:hypothetical protein PVAND_016339 [Polypedilum vanderplanki]